MALANLGKCAVVTELRRRLEQVVNLRTPVLFISEPGAGAELCARFLHQPHTPWLCPEDSIKLAENPLDLAQEAKDGVLFLSSIDKLNRLEQKGLALLIGRAERFNARIVCVAPKAVFQYAEQGLFDADLLYALGGLTIPVPALREHSEDVPDLANLLLVKCIENAALPLRHFSMSALNLLRQYDWPGNLMQLDSVVRTLALTSLTEEIGVEEVKRVMSRYEVLRISPVRDVSLDTPLREARDAFERLYFEHQIAKAEGNMSRVAENVGLERTHLYRKLKQLGVKLSKREE
jgi:DNA-binding NtrC family response regulator